MSEQQISSPVAERSINFMGQRKMAAFLSLLLILGSLASLLTKGLNFGLDFTGGTLVEVGYSEVESLPNIRATIEKAGYKNAVVVHFGTETDILIRLPQGYSDQLGPELLAALQKDFAGDIELRRIEFVGPQVGDELKEQGGLAMLLALALVMLYIAIRFQFKFSVGAVLALVHDVIITLGFFSLLQLDVDLTVLAAVLAVIGYSLNDTIVVFDRIRENFRLIRKGSAESLINTALTETLERTLMTSLTTLLVLIVLFIFGGELIHGFAIALIIGVVVGTYSSIYVASNILLMMGISKEDLIVPVKEGAEVDHMP
jgi:preprotein translocase subunit SecF